MIEDAQLLREFAQSRSEAAFRTLVERHLGLVFSTALRQTGDPPVAEDIAQAVFIILAKKAAQLKEGTIVAGWLYRATRLATAHAIRAAARRTLRERAAAELAELQNTTDDEAKLEFIRPVLDHALSQLRSKDRDAVLLRYLQGRSLSEVGSAIGCSEEAARKRIDRAVERLRSFFQQRGSSGFRRSSLGQRLGDRSSRRRPDGN